MIGTLILLAIVGVIASFIPMPDTIKKIIYVVLGIVALLVILPLAGIHVPIR